MLRFCIPVTGLPLAAAQLVLRRRPRWRWLAATPQGRGSGTKGSSAKGSGTKGRRHGVGPYRSRLDAALARRVVQKWEE